MNVQTRVGRYDVPVLQANKPMLYYFRSGAHGKKEAGVYAFWTVVIRKKGKKRIIGRALTSLPPGDRFDRMKREMRTAKSKKARTAYRHFWNLIRGGKAIRYIRPSTNHEVKRWADGHESDAKHAKRMRLPR